MGVTPSEYLRQCVSCLHTWTICTVNPRGLFDSSPIPRPARYDVDARPFVPAVSVEYVMMRRSSSFGTKAANTLAKMIMAEAAAMHDEPF